MDTKAINEQLEALKEGENCVLVTTQMYNTISTIQRGYPGLKLLHKPISITHPTYLNLLTSNGVEIVCSNMEVLESVKKVGVVSSDLPTKQLISASQALGCSVYQVTDVRTARAISALCPDAVLDLLVDREVNTDIFQHAPLPITGLTVDRELGCAEDVCQTGELIHTLLEIAASYGHKISTVTVGLVTNTGSTALHQAIQALAGSLAPHVTPCLTLSQEVFTESIMIAARVLDTEETEGELSYTVDLSMYGELAMYLECNTIYTNDGTTPGVIKGNSYDEDDIIIQGLVPDTLHSDWIILRGIALADFRGFNLHLVDSEHRLVSIEDEVADSHCNKILDVPAPIIVM